MNDLEQPLRRIILDCAYLRVGAIADRVKQSLAERAASGVYGADEHWTLWDEYRYEVQEGPTPTLDGAWDFDLLQIVQSLVRKLPKPDAVLCSVAMSFMMDGDEAGLLEEPSVYEDAIIWGVRQRLYQMADEESFRAD